MGIYEDYRNSALIVDAERAEGKIIVLARGTFDLPHEGHIDFLKRAKDLGDILMVNIKNDRWCAMTKGETVKTENERARYLASLGDMVDYVFVEPSYDIHPAIKLALFCRPDILVREDKDPEIQEEERRILSEHPDYKPKYVTLARSNVELSSSELRRRIEAKVYGDLGLDIERYERIINAATIRAKAKKRV